MQFLPQYVVVASTHPMARMNHEVQFEYRQHVHQQDVEESRSFMVGFANGIWISALLTAVGYFVVRLAA